MVCTIILMLKSFLNTVYIYVYLLYICIFLLLTRLLLSHFRN